MKVYSEYKKQGDDARLILTGMLVNSQVLGAVAQKWEPGGLFDVPHMDRIGGWAVQHYNEFHKSPGTAIQNYYARWSETEHDKDEEKDLERFLAGLSAEYVKRERKTLQADYVIKTAEKHFNKVRFRQLGTQLQDLASANQVEKAQALYHKFRNVEMGEEDATDVFEDRAGVIDAFAAQAEPLIVYPDALGNFFSGVMIRKAFVSFEAPEKRGKSFFILDAACRAVQQGRKVLYFEAGDLSKGDVIERLSARVLNRPLDTDEYLYPIAIEESKDDDDGKFNPIHDTRRHEKPVGPKTTWKGFTRFVEKYGKGMFKLSCHSARSLSVTGIKAKLDQLRDRDGWVPDVVCVDYADILAPVNGTAETRDQINTTWMMLRSISMSHACLVITATQTNRGSYKSDLIEMEHASEDKRKRAHVTASIGINQTEVEYEKGMYRLNYIVRRKGKFAKNRVVYLAGCLSVSNPAVLSAFAPQ